MPVIELRQPELVDIENSFEPGETLDILGYSAAMIEDMQIDPREVDLAVISGVATVCMKPLEVEYSVPLTVDGRKLCISSFPALQRVNSGNGNWGLPSGLIDGSSYRNREDWLASWHVLELMQVPGIPSFDELAAAETEDYQYLI